jgi:heme exporter protein C
MTRSSWLGGAAVVLLAAGAYAGLIASPPDAFQGEYVRIMYAHVPNAWVAYVAFALVFVTSILYLWKRRPEYDRVAHSAAELGVLFTGLALVTGSIWGRPVWGVWWTWDARLVTTAILFLIYVGYLLVRGLADDPVRGARLAAVIGIVGFLDVPVIHFSVRWFRTLHQLPSVTRGDISLAPPMLAALLISITAFTVLFAYLLTLRVRLQQALADLEGQA